MEDILLEAPSFLRKNSTAKAARRTPTPCLKTVAIGTTASMGIHRRKLAEKDEKWTSKRLQCNLDIGTLGGATSTLFFTLSIVVYFHFKKRSKGMPIFSRRGMELRARRLQNVPSLPSISNDMEDVSIGLSLDIPFYSTPTVWASLFSPATDR